MVDRWTAAQASATSKQNRKFKHLRGTQHPGDQVDTDKVLDSAAIVILSKGLNLAQSTDIRPHTKGFISGTEQAIQHLPRDT